MSYVDYVRHRYLITYDIVDAKRRTKIFDLCNNEGDRVQYSVFIAELNKMELIILKGEINKFIDLETDQVLFVDLGVSKRSSLEIISSLGKRYEPPVRSVVI